MVTGVLSILPVQKEKQIRQQLSKICILKKEREYMLYLPLYDGLISLSIGVDSLATISQPLVDYPIRKILLFFYGTSILQGGCASRPGMAHTNIISRRLNRECIN